MGEQGAESLHTHLYCLKGKYVYYSLTYHIPFNVYHFGRVYLQPKNWHTLSAMEER